MRFHLQLHGNLPVDAYPVLARRAERLGFEDVTLHDVVLRRPVWPLLCEMARATSRVLVGPNVTHPYLSHPVRIAANLAHLDEVSEGRAVLGIGRGSMYDLVGCDDPSTLAGLQEAIDVIGALVGGAGGPYGGTVFRLAGPARLRFGTGRRVPVHLGALGPKGARFAGAHCAGLRAAAQWDPAYALMLRDQLRAGAIEAGRDPDGVELVVENWTFVHPDRERARREARVLLAGFLPYLGPLLSFHRIPAAEIEAARAVNDKGDIGRSEEIGDRTVDLFMAAGDLTDLSAGLDRLAASGLTAVSFSGVLGPDTGAALELIGAAMSTRMEPAGTGSGAEGGSGEGTGNRREDM